MAVEAHLTSCMLYFLWIYRGGLLSMTGAKPALEGTPGWVCNIHFSICCL